MNIWENINLAIRSIRSNILRAILTLMIIAFGIMALVGILTAIDSAIYSLSNNLSSLGANTFDINPLEEHGRREGRQTKQGAPITYKEALDFKDRYAFSARTSLSLPGGGSAQSRPAASIHPMIAGQRISRGHAG